MAKNLTIKDYTKLKKISTVAKMYKEGVSAAYIYKLIEQEKAEAIIIDGVYFLDISTLPESIKRNLKK